MPSTVFSNAPSFSTSLLCDIVRSGSDIGVSTRLVATCLSIVDGLRRKDVDGGLSYEEADARDGVAIAVGLPEGVLLLAAEEL